MKKQILNLGKALDKVAQKEINGGFGPGCTPGIHASDCLNDGPNGVVFHPYNGGLSYWDPANYGECCVFPT